MSITTQHMKGQKMSTYVWRAGFKTQQAAESAWIDDMESGQASACELNAIKSYRFEPNQPIRWLIELKH